MITINLVCHLLEVKKIVQISNGFYDLFKKKITFSRLTFNKRRVNKKKIGLCKQKFRNNFKKMKYKRDNPKYY